MFRLFTSKCNVIKSVARGPSRCPCNSRGITLYRPLRRYGDEEAGGQTARRYLWDHIDFPRLSRQQVTSIISYLESSFELPDGPVKSFETNKLPSNNPTEDRASSAKLRIPDVTSYQYLFGVYDGHAGCACAQTVSERLLNYISVMLAPLETLDRICDGRIDPCDDLIYRFPHRDSYLSADMSEIHKIDLKKLATEILSAQHDDTSIRELLQAAFTRLDHDILHDALPGSTNTSVNIETMALAISGACACVAFVDETDLYVANAGDCQAVLGVQTEEDKWEAVELSSVHSGENEDEVKRIMNQHPTEASTLLRGGRLLGDLAPLRAFGDARYKWPKRVMKHILNTSSNSSLVSVYGDHLIPGNYFTPPYLTAEPEVVHHALNPRDKFLVIASDGLWEHLEPQQVVNLVAGHMDGKQVLRTDFTLPYPDMTLKEINDLLVIRKSKLAKKPMDENVATHLLRLALGPDHAKLSHSLTLPESVVRNVRDDITITVVYFNTEYIRNKAYQYHEC